MVGRYLILRPTNDSELSVTLRPDEDVTGGENGTTGHLSIDPWSDVGPEDDRRRSGQVVPEVKKTCYSYPRPTGTDVLHVLSVRR